MWQMDGENEDESGQRSRTNILKYPEKTGGAGFFRVKISSAVPNILWFRIPCVPDFRYV